MAFDHDAEIRILGEDLFQESGIVSQSIARVGPDIALVVVEESVLGLLRQYFLAGQPGRASWRRWRRRWRADRYGNGSRIVTPRTSGGQGVAGSASRKYLPLALALYSADALA